MTKLFSVFAVFFLFSSVCNAEILRFSSVGPGIYRGSEPQDDQDYKMLQSYKIKSILNLRTFLPAIHKDKKNSKRLNINFKSIRLSGVFSPSDEDINEALTFITNPTNQPVFIHCHYGKDRTGLVIALYRVLFQHWHPEAAYDEWVDIGFSTILKGLSSYFWDRTESDSHDLIQSSGF